MNNVAEMAIVFPSSFYSIHRVDESLQAEYDAALETGLYDVILFSFDEWVSEYKLILENSAIKSKKAIYRGWMMKPEDYMLFYKELSSKELHLVTTPEEYEHLHIFPNVYPELCEDTANRQNPNYEIVFQV